MLVVVGGSGLRTEQELRKLFADTGLGYQRAIKAPADLCLIEAAAEQPAD